MEKVWKAVATTFGGAIGIVWTIAGPITYVLLVVETWKGNSPVWLKLIINLTLDAFLSVIWPITWALWGIQHLMGKATPLSVLFG
ncbi:MAG: hypothetical protein ACKVP5_15335 [Aestuariivirga sp.]